MNVEELEGYIVSLDCKIYNKDIVNFIWILEIKRIKN